MVHGRKKVCCNSTHVLPSYIILKRDLNEKMKREIKIGDMLTVTDKSSPNVKPKDLNCPLVVDCITFLSIRPSVPLYNVLLMEVWIAHLSKAVTWLSRLLPGGTQQSASYATLLLLKYVQTCKPTGLFAWREAVWCDVSSHKTGSWTSLKSLTYVTHQPNIWNKTKNIILILKDSPLWRNSRENRRKMDRRVK